MSKHKNPKESKNKMGNHNDGRVSENNLTSPVLRILARAPNGFLTTSQLIAPLVAQFKPDGKDAETIESRNDTYFSQKVRNIISHRDSPTNPVAKGWIDYHADAKGLQITEAGRAEKARLDALGQSL